MTLLNHLFPDICSDSTPEFRVRVGAFDVSFCHLCCHHPLQCCDLDRVPGRTRCVSPRALPPSKQWPRAATRSPLPSSVQVVQPRKPTLKSAKDKVNPDAARDAARRQNLQVGEGSRSVERFHWSIVRCSEVQVGEGEEAAKAPQLNVQISSTQEFIRRIGRLRSGAHSRIQVIGGG